MVQWQERYSRTQRQIWLYEEVWVFFTTQPKDSGSRLTVSGKPADINGGSIEAWSEADKESTFKVVLFAIMFGQVKGSHQRV
jgi:hypothetical protein